MSKPPLLTPREIIRAFKKIGYTIVHQKGSHIKLMNYETGMILIVPNHREVDRWTLKAIIKDAGISIEEFVALL